MSPEMKEDNLKLAKKRIFVEHVIRLLKAKIPLLFREEETGNGE